MFKSISFFCVFIITLSGLTFPIVGFSQSQVPHQLVSDTLDELRLALKGKSKDFEYQQVVQDVLFDKVDLDFISKRVMGKEHYLGATDQQRDSFKQVFETRLIKTYSTSLAIFKDADIEVIPESQFYAGDKLAGVSLLFKSDGGVYPMRFTLKLSDEGEWKIVNIVLNGINVGKIFNNQFLDALKSNNNNLDRVIKNWEDQSSSNVTHVAGSDDQLKGWKEIFFKGKTEYTGGNECIEAKASASASGLISETRLAVTENTKLSWSWRADQLIQSQANAKEKSEQGDDFVARVFVIKEGNLPWQTKALNYVWSKENIVGDSWINPIVKNAKMVVVQSGEEGLGQWKTFERNIQDDFKKYFDMEIDSIDGVALMTDTDNTNGVAEACYVLPQIIEPENIAVINQR